MIKNNINKKFMVMRLNFFIIIECFIIPAYLIRFNRGYVTNWEVDNNKVHMTFTWVPIFKNIYRFQDISKKHLSTFLKSFS